MNLDSNRMAFSPTLSQVFHHSCYAMNTRFSMVLVGLPSMEAEELARMTEAELRRQEALMSRFDVQSPVARLNRYAKDVDVAVPDELWEILISCRHYWKRTLGAFDITQWPLSQVWRKHLGRGTEPTLEEIEQAQKQAGMEYLELNNNARTVRFHREGMSLDLGGIGKGIALEEVARKLSQKGVQQAFLSFGESSITTLGAHPHGPAWPVGIANLFRSCETVHTFQLCNTSLSSSGTAPSSCKGGSKVFGNIIDPRSGRPFEGYRTMHVMGPSGIEAEVLSTALLVTSREERAPLLTNFSATAAVEIEYQRQQNEIIPVSAWRYEL